MTRTVAASLTALAAAASIVAVSAGSGHTPRALQGPNGVGAPGTTALSTSAATASGAASRPASVVKTLPCERLPHVPGKAATTALVTFPPLAHSPAHRHPGSVSVYVVKGAVRSQMAGSPPHTYPAGTTWFEPPGALHLFAQNPSASEPAELLAVFIADENCARLVIPDQ